MQPAAPRHFVRHPTLAEAGLPEREAQVAARREFAAIKQELMAALQAHGKAGSDWLYGQVRAAEQPLDLWLLRAPIYEALAGGGTERRAARRTVRQTIDTFFPDPQDGGGASGFASF